MKRGFTLLLSLFLTIGTMWAQTLEFTFAKVSESEATVAVETEVVEYADEATINAFFAELAKLDELSYNLDATWAALPAVVEGFAAVESVVEQVEAANPVPKADVEAATATVAEAKAVAVYYNETYLPTAKEAAELLAALEEGSEEYVAVNEAITSTSDLSTVTTVAELEAKVAVLDAAIEANTPEGGVVKTNYTDAITNAAVTSTEGWNAVDASYGDGLVKYGSGKTVDFNQTITLPAGQYKVTAQAAYRYGSGSVNEAEQVEYAAILDGTTDTHLATLYAETSSYKYETDVQNRWEGRSETDYFNNLAKVSAITVEGEGTYYVPNSSAAVKCWFDNGKYVNELVFNVQEEGQVKIGIAKTEAPGPGDYTNIGAWTLTRLGDAEADPKEEEPGEEPGDDTEETIPVDMTHMVGTSKEAWNATGGPVVIDGVSMPEVFQETSAETGDVMWQTVTGLENGKYTVELWANARVAWRESAATDGQEELTYLTANNVEISMQVLLNPGLNSNKSYVLEDVEVTDGTLKICMTKKAAGSNWHTIQIKSLTYHAPADVALNVAKEELKAALDAANAVSPVKDDFVAAIATAQDVYDNSKSADEVNAATATLKEATKLAILGNASLENPVLTDFVVNGTFDAGTAPWKSTTGAQNQALADNQKGAFTGKFFENWNGSNYTGKIYQVIENIPNGLYELSICAFVETFNASAQFVYANADKVALVAGAPTAYTVRTKVTDGKIEVGFEQTEAVNRWCGIDNISLTYLGNVDELSLYNKTRAEAELLLEKKMSAEALEALQAALAIEVNESSSDEAIAAANAEIVAAMGVANASVTFFATNKTAIDAMYALMESTNVYTAEAFLAYKNIADEYKAQYEAGTLTATVDNPATIHGWRASVDYDDMLLSAFGVKDFEGLPYINTWSTEGEADGSDFKVPFFEYHKGGANTLDPQVMKAEVSGLTAGQYYSLEAWVRVSSMDGVAAAEATGITLSVGEGEPVDVTEGAVVGTTSLSHGVFTAYGYADAEGKLTINFSILEGNNINWLSFKNLKYAEAVKGTDEQKQALSEAIAKAEDYTLGFAEGEYAPYTNVDALKALAAAKAVDVDNVDSDVLTAILATLEAAVWTANTEEMNAIYDGSFEYAYSTNGNVQPIAWHGINNHDNATDIRYMWDASANAGLSATSTGKALFTKYNAFYGTETGYTMPLKENSVYELTFVYGGWSDCQKDGYVTITGPDDAVIALSADRLPLDAVDGHQNAASWKTYTATFTTGAAGNYVLGLRKDREAESKQSQYVYGDFNLRYVGAAVVEPEYLTVVGANVGDVAIEEGVATVSSISTIDVIFDRPVAKAEDAGWATLADSWGPTNLDVAVLEAEEGSSEYVVRFSVSQEFNGEFTEAGEYELTIPEGYLVGAEDANYINAEISAIITIEAAPATPLAVTDVTVGEDVMTDLSAIAATPEDEIKVNFDGQFYFQGEPTIVDAEGNDASEYFEYQNGLDVDGSNSYIFKGKKAGIYTITLAKASFLEMMQWKAPAEDIVLTVEIFVMPYTDFIVIPFEGDELEEFSYAELMIFDLVENVELSGEVHATLTTPTNVDGEILVASHYLDEEIPEEPCHIITFEGTQVYTAPGAYTLTIPEGLFTVDGAPNAATVVNFTVMEPVVVEFEAKIVSVTPAEGEVTELSEIIVQFDSDIVRPYSNVFVTNEAGEEFEFELDPNHDDITQARFFAKDGAITAAGTYTLDCSQIDHLVNRLTREKINPFTGTYTWTIKAGENGIDNINADADAVIYDIHGRRVTEMTKGIYIVNGKKVVIK